MPPEERCGADTRTRGGTPMFGKCVRVTGLRRSTALPLLTATIACLVLATPAAAEWFTDLYLGGAFTEKHDVDTKFPTTSGQVTTLDVTFNNSFVGGIRGGYWFPFDLGLLNNLALRAEREPTDAHLLFALLCQRGVR
jgi:hypothetical protein